MKMQTDIASFGSVKGDPVTALNELHNKMCKFINGSNLAIRTATNENFLDVIKFAVDNAETLKKNGQLWPGPLQVPKCTASSWGTNDHHD